MTTSERQVVATLERAIAQRIGEPRFELWFDHHTKFHWDEDELTVGVPNHFFQEWLQKTFAEAVRSAASEVIGRPMRVRFVIDPELFQAARRAEGQAPAAAPSGQERGGPTASAASLRVAAKARVVGETPAAIAAEFAQEFAAEPARPRPAPQRRWRKLADFVVGACNRLAHASALSVVEAPAQGANPLLLHGPVGTGKTHLLEGIYVGLRRARPEWRVCFVTAEDFTHRFVQAMRLGKLGAFRKQFRECDALLLDDLNFLASKRATQEEFLHTFDVLHAEGKQIVLTSDCHPRLADEFTPEVTDRLLGGAVWGLTPPDADTRLAILQAKSARDEPPVPEEALRLLAEQLRGNVRELEGTLHSLRHVAHVAGRPIDLQLAREALGDRLRHSVRVIQLADVDRAVRQVLRLGDGALQSKQRSWAVSHPRMLAMFLSRKHTSAAYSEIGDYFGGRNHSTAVAAEKKVRLWLQDNGELVLGERRLRVKEVVELVERELQR